MIISYQKAADTFSTFTLNAPEGSTELATVDGVTFVAVPNGVPLPDNQPVAIKDSIKTVVLTDAQKAEIKAVSPHVELIAQRMIEKIRERYSVEDELYLSRIGVGAANRMYTPAAKEITEMSEFGSYVEGVRQWGRDERAKIGL